MEQDVLPQQLEVDGAVGIAVEKELSSVAALRDVVRHIHGNHTREASHGATKISENFPSVPELPPTGIVQSNNYNSRLQPIVLTATSPNNSSPVLSLSYDFHLGNHDNGNVYGITNGRDNANRPSGSPTFTYDALNRIATAGTSGTDCTVMQNGLTKNWAESYTIDAWGNLLGIAPTKCSAENLSVTSNTVYNRLDQYCYDAAGNMTGAPPCGTPAYTYDAENRLKGASGVTYTYDGDGKRVMKSNGKLYWTGTGSDPLEESDLAGNSTAEYVFFWGRRIARLDLPSLSPHFYFSDHLGSAAVITSSDGSVVEQESDFYPYGAERPIVGGSNNYKLAEKERDPESSLDDFGARFYSSNIGRFVSADWSIVPAPVPYVVLGNPQTLNLYAYVENNPTSAVDPDGHEEGQDGPAAIADTFDRQTAANEAEVSRAALNMSPTSAALVTFVQGAGDSIISGVADVLRLGVGTAEGIQDVQNGNYAGAASNFAQDGGRAAAVILSVVGAAGGGGATAGDASGPRASVVNDLNRSSTTTTSPAGRTTTTVTDPAGSTTYKTTPGKTGGQSTIIIRKDTGGNVKYVKQEAWHNAKDVTKPADHVHFYKPIDKVVK